MRFTIQTAVIVGLGITESSTMTQAAPIKVQSNITAPHQLSFVYEIPTAGQLNVDEDPLIGLEYRYFYPKTFFVHPYSNLGFKTDTDKTGISTDLIYLDLGARYIFNQARNYGSYTDLSIGATYGREEYALGLIDRVASGSFEEFGLKTSLAFGYQFDSGYDIRLGLTDFSSGISGRTIGLTFGYRF